MHCRGSLTQLLEACVLAARVALAAALGLWAAAASAQAGAALAPEQQRLALVVGIGTIASQQVLPAAARDAQAVAAALRAGGFVVMLREDLGSAALRGTLAEFRNRLTPGGTGLVYFTGLGAQLDGKNVLLPRDTRLDPDLKPEDQAAWMRVAAVGVQELVDALPPVPGGGPRLLLVDAAYAHPALERLPQRGLAAQPLPAGVMALLGDVPRAVQAAPAPPPLPNPLPRDPSAMAATVFARELASALITPRINGPELLRAVRFAVSHGPPARAAPWLAGDTAARTDLADAALLEGLALDKPLAPAQAGAGEMSVEEVLRQATRPRPAPVVVAAAANAASAPALPAIRLAAPAAVVAGAALTATSAPTPLVLPPAGSAARSNEFGFAEGDSYTFQVIDALKPAAKGTFTTTVEAVLVDGQMLANGQQMQLDPQGRVKRQVLADGTQVLYEPYQALWWAQPKSGETRPVRFTEIYRRSDNTRGEIEWKGSATVGVPVRIETPLGALETVPIEASGWLYETRASGPVGAARFMRRLWFAPRLGHPVVVESEDTDGQGQVLRRERIELTRAKVARGAP